MKAGPLHVNMPASLIEFCRMQRMLSAGDIYIGGMIGEDSRAERVNLIRNQIEQGRYENGQLDVALDRMIDGASGYRWT